MNDTVLEIYTDGASRGNPGEAAWAYVFVTEGTVIGQHAEFLGISTNNVAEYHAVIHALAEALRQGWRRVVLYSDSELIVRQITGRYQVRKAHLVPLRKEVEGLRAGFEEIGFRSVSRSHPHVARADQLCNAVLDRETHRPKKN
jgi:ribonuclease HI